MKLSLKEDRLFVVLEKVGEKKVHGIIIPDEHSERSRMGIVKEIGPDVKSYGVGDKVLVSWYSGTRLHLDGETLYGEPVDEDSFRVLRECEILAQIVED